MTASEGTADISDLNDNDSQERARKVVLSLTTDMDDRLAGLVADWQRDRIAWVAVVGVDCAEVERHIKALLSGDVANRARFLMTSAHPTETIDEVAEFMLELVGEYEGDVAIVEI